MLREIWFSMTLTDDKNRKITGDRVMLNLFVWSDPPMTQSYKKFRKITGDRVTLCYVMTKVLENIFIWLIWLVPSAVDPMVYASVVVWYAAQIKVMSKLNVCGILFTHTHTIPCIHKPNTNIIYEGPNILQTLLSVVYY